MLVKVLHLIIEVLIILVVIHALGSWIPQIRESRFYYYVDRIVDPLLEPIRRVVPSVGGVDFSPMILIFILILIDRALLR
jgi:YggT family protein